MLPIITAEQMRKIDRLTAEEYAVPSLLLMESAANSCFRAIAARFPDDLPDKKIRILCGPGNNGGDGAALARVLANVGVHTDVVLFGKIESTKGDARANFEIVRSLGSFAAGSTDRPGPLSFLECDTISAWEEIARPRRTYDCIVDALFGTGLTRPLEGLFLQVVQHLSLITRARDRSSGKRPLIVSIDIPSGLNADLATPIGEAVEADLTITLTAPKPANVLPPASHLCGELEIAHIGSPAALIEAANPQLFLTGADDVRRWLKQTRYTAESYKNTHGHVLLIAGSRGYTGAAVLSGNAAIKSGAGLVTIATPASAQSSVVAQVMPEVMTTALAETDRGAVSDSAIDHVMKLSEKATVVAIGPGLSAEDERTRTFVRQIVERRTTPVVIDADGLNCLAPWSSELRGSSEAPIILTPHPGEMLRLIGKTDKDSLSNRVAAVRGFAREHNVILVLKGSRTLIGSPDGRVFVNSTGNAGLGTAGAGDTLTGIIAGFQAQARGTLGVDADELETTIAAVYIGGLAGDIAAKQIGMRTMVASDIRDHLSSAVLSLDSEGEVPHNQFGKLYD
jgi:NAD(P)H-hydrate epimerase